MMETSEKMLFPVTELWLFTGFWNFPVSLLGSLIKQEMRSTAFGKIYIKIKKCRTKSVAIRPHLFDI